MHSPCCNEQPFSRLLAMVFSVTSHKCSMQGFIRGLIGFPNTHLWFKYICHHPVRRLYLDITCFHSGGEFPSVNQMPGDCFGLIVTCNCVLCRPLLHTPYVRPEFSADGFPDWMWPILWSGGWVNRTAVHTHVNKAWMPLKTDERHQALNMATI